MVVSWQIGSVIASFSQLMAFRIDWSMGGVSGAGARWNPGTR